MANEIKLSYGLAEITVGGTDIGLQGGAAEFTAEPIVYDIENYEVGLWDQVLDSWNVRLSVNFAQEDFEKLKLAIPFMQEIKQTTTTIGLKDGAIGQTARALAKEIVVHPKSFGASTEGDITIFKAFPTGSFKKSYGKEASTYTVEFRGLSKTGAKTAGEFFRIGKETV